MRKKVFFLTNAMEVGGGERVIKLLQSSLSKEYDFKIITLRKPREYSKIVLQHPPEPLLGSTSNLLMAFLFPLHVRKLRQIINREKPAKVISFLELSNFVNITANKKAIVSFRTSMDYFKGFKGAVYKWIIRRQYKKANRIVFNSLENKELFLRETGMSESRGVVIYNPFDNRCLKSNASRPVEFQSLKGKRIFISVGRLNSDKNWEGLVTSFKSMAMKDHKNVLVIIGDGPKLGILKNLSSEKGLAENIFFLGKKDNVFPYLMHSDYFIFYSYAEGFPNALIEAIACGLPIITNDFRTGARELIHPGLDFRKKLNYPHIGPNGVLLRGSCSEEYAKDLAKTVNVLRFIKQKKQGFGRFSMDTVSEEWKKIIDEE